MFMIEIVSERICSKGKCAAKGLEGIIDALKLGLQLCQGYFGLCWPVTAA